jgi:osmotically-inducible protein OsmY
MKFRSLSLVCILLVGSGINAWGQLYNSGSTSTSAGLFGTRTIGQNVTAGVSTFGGTSSMGGMSGMGMSNTSGLSGMTGTTGISQTSTSTGQFIGANTGQTGFVGAAQAGTQNSSRNSTQSYGLNSGNYGSSGNYSSSNQYNRGSQQYNSNYGQSGYGNQSGSNQNQLSVVRRVVIDFPKKSNADISSALSQRLQKTAGLHCLSPLEASFQGDTLILKGVVATAHDRDLAERLARLEPGVDQIQNDLVVK